MDNTITVTTINNAHPVVSDHVPLQEEILDMATRQTVLEDLQQNVIGKANIHVQTDIYTCEEENGFQNISKDDVQKWYEKDGVDGVLLGCFDAGTEVSGLQKEESILTFGQVKKACHRKGILVGQDGVVDLRKEFAKDYGDVKDHLIFSLEKEGLSAEDREKIPTKEVAGHFMVANLFYEIGKSEVGSAIVTNSQMETWGIDKEQLFSDAMENAQRILPLQVEGLHQKLFGEDLKGDMLVLTNAQEYLGAGAALYPGALDEVARTMGGDIFLMPSSKHELIAAPAHQGSLDKDLANYEEIVRDSNHFVVRQEDILSNDVLYYSARQRQLMPAEEAVSKDKGKQSVLENLASKQSQSKAQEHRDPHITRKVEESR